MDVYKKLDNYLADTRAWRYPITDHPLKQRSDYCKSSYYILLCIVMQFGGDVKAGQIQFLQRLIAGCGAEETIETYARQASGLESGDFEGLFRQVVENDMKSDFTLDSMIMLCLGGVTDERAEFLAKILEGLQVSPKLTEETARICQAIMAQNFVDLLKCRGSRCARDLLRYFEIKTWEQDVDWEGVKYSIAPQMRKKIIGEDNYVASDCVVSDREHLYLSNIDFELQYHLALKNIGCVELENCQFHNMGEMGLYFFNCGSILLRRCSFSGCTETAVTLEKCKEIIIEESTFENCVASYSRRSNNWMKSGLVIHGSQNIPLRLLNSRFINCGGRNSYCVYTSSFISECNATIEGCYFENCWNKYYSSIDPENPARVMFSNIAFQQDNTVQKSAALGPTA